MKREDFMTAFARLSEEEQESIRAALGAKVGSQGGWDPQAKCRQMMQRMKCCEEASFEE